MKYKIQVRDVNLKFIGDVQQWVRLEYSLVMNDRGEWRLTVPFDSDSARLLLDIFVPGNRGIGGIYVERNGKYVFSGPALNRREIYNDEGHFLIIEGADEMDLIYRTLALAHPKRFQSPYMRDNNGYHTDQTPNSLNADSSSGPMQSGSVIHTIIWDNIGESAAVENGKQPRRIPQLRTINNALGSWRSPAGKYADGRYFSGANPILTRGENMLDVIQSIVDYSESTEFNPDGTIKKDSHPFIYRVTMAYRPGLGADYGGWWITAQPEVITDKTFEVVFSPELSNMANYEYSIDAPEANIIQVAGSGEGKNRLFVHAGDEISRRIYGDREGFSEYNGANIPIDTPANIELNILSAELHAQLDKQGEKTSITFQPINKPDIEFIEHWTVGDRVRIRIRSDEIKPIVRKVNVAVSDNREEISAEVGDGGVVSTGIRLLDQIQQLQYKYNNLTKRTAGE